MKNEKYKTKILPTRIDRIFVLARPEGFEPPASRIGICCDIQLRHGRMNIYYYNRFSSILQEENAIFFKNIQKNFGFAHTQANKPDFFVEITGRT